MKLTVQSVNEAVYSTIRDGILQGTYPSGRRLSIEALASQLGVSSTPVRDALKRLEADGLVTIRPRSGTHVTLPTLQDVEEVFDLRALLESFAAGRATDAITDEALDRIEQALDDTEARPTDESFIDSDRLLHGELVAAAGNRRLSQMLDSLRQQIELFRIICVRDRDADMQYVRDHRAIIAGLRTRDARRVEKALTQHIKRVRAQTLRLWPRAAAGQQDSGGNG
jgi:DNA-binding GntR family transcriptional regulator